MSKIGMVIDWPSRAITATANQLELSIIKQAKDLLLIESDDFDAILIALTKQVMLLFENHTQCLLYPCTIKVNYASWIGCFNIPFLPQVILSVKITSELGVQTTAVINKDYFLFDGFKRLDANCEFGLELNLQTTNTKVPENISAVLVDVICDLFQAEKRQLTASHKAMFNQFRYE